MTPIGGDAPTSDAPASNGEEPIKVPFERDLAQLFAAWSASTSERSIGAFSLFLERTTGVGLSQVLTDVERRALVDSFGESWLEGLDGGP